VSIPSSALENRDPLKWLARPRSPFRWRVAVRPTAPVRTEVAMLGGRARSARRRADGASRHRRGARDVAGAPNAARRTFGTAGVPAFRTPGAARYPSGHRTGVVCSVRANRAWYGAADRSRDDRRLRVAFSSAVPIRRHVALPMWRRPTPTGGWCRALVLGARQGDPDRRICRYAGCMAKVCVTMRPSRTRNVSVPRGAKPGACHTM
jgi:hypothetical protein